MPKVYTQFNRPKTIPAPPGDNFIDVFQEEITKDGHKEIVKVGEKNVYDMIQEDLEQSKIENILAAAAMGDLSVLKAQEPVYIDATTFPKTMMEAQNIVVKAKQEFEKMPQEVKDLFENSPELYVSKMGTQEFLDIMSPYNEKLKKINEAGSLEEYNKKVAAQAKFEKDVAAAKEVTTSE